MLNPLERFQFFLGPQRFRLFALSLILTGLLSIALSFVGTEWAISLQTVLALAFIFAAAYIIGGRMDAQQRLTWLAILMPAFGLVVLAVAFVPQYQFALFGAAFGWTLVGIFIFGRNRAPMQYREAVKAMRKGNYKDAVALMDDLIKDEPDDPNHYRFRAELLRLWGKLGRARRDYNEMVERGRNDAERAVGYNGVAEVDLQAEKFDDALKAANQAYELAPQEWVAAYNLGMIQDRLGQSQAVIESLTQALKVTVPDERHRLLIHLYLLRAHARLDNLEAAQEALADMKQAQAGLQEWQHILREEQAATLRDVLSDDVAQAEKLISGDLGIGQLVQELAQ